MNPLPSANRQPTVLFPTRTEQESTFSNFQLVASIIALGLIGGLMLGCLYSLFIGFFNGLVIGLSHGLIAGSMWALIWYVKWSKTK